MLAISILWTVLAVLSCLTETYQASLGERAITQLSQNDLKSLISNPDPIKSIDPSDPHSHVSKILIPRVSDTENNTLVGDYIINTMKNLNWHVEVDKFEDDTPIGRRKFRNIIATKNKDASRRVILSAHYDSKYFPNFPDNQFVGATDSAAPCAMMLDLAEALNPLLDARQKEVETGVVEDEDVADMTLQLVFFDGEEAFVSWTDTDSIYGARHLAEKWDNEYLAPHDKRRLMGMGSTELATIEHLILIDLLGAPQPLIRSYFLDTAWLFDALVSVEKRLGDSGAFTTKNDNSMAPGNWKSYFLPRNNNKMNWGYMGDDHVPFLKKGVSVLHLIPEPFPHVWHQLGDDATALDIPTMRRWNLLLRVFMAEYLHLKPSAHSSTTTLQRSASELE